MSLVLSWQPAMHHPVWSWGILGYNGIAVTLYHTKPSITSYFSDGASGVFHPFRSNLLKMQLKGGGAKNFADVLCTYVAPLNLCYLSYLRVLSRKPKLHAILGQQFPKLNYNCIIHKTYGLQPLFLPWEDQRAHSLQITFYNGAESQTLKPKNLRDCSWEHGMPQRQTGWQTPCSSPLMEFQGMSFLEFWDIIKLVVPYYRVALNLG